MDELIEVPLHRALHRSNLIWGGDRKAMIFALFLVAVIILPAMNKVSFAVGIIFGVAAVLALRAMAKRDPMMREVYVRQVRYKDYYPARSGAYRVSNSARVY